MALLLCCVLCLSCRVSELWHRILYLYRASVGISANAAPTEALSVIKLTCMSRL
ncbi:hypothetical protein HMPREF1248_0370 [Coriobacteriaceae bacterium BV3Ac1]|nr:hypothetical protein HMPREF1248_0370 [Coriobacteriaceae bacterium BV3Ac1]